MDNNKYIKYQKWINTWNKKMFKPWELLIGGIILIIFSIMAVILYCMRISSGDLEGSITTIIVLIVSFLFGAGGVINLITCYKIKALESLSK